jgi:hypothetical protein
MSQHVAETFKSNLDDENIFKSICGGDLKKKIHKMCRRLSSQTWLMYTSLNHSVTTSLGVSGSGGGGGGGGAVVVAVSTKYSILE